VNRRTYSDPLDGLRVYVADAGRHRCKKTAAVPVIAYTIVTVLAQLVLTLRSGLP